MRYLLKYGLILFTFIILVLVPWFLSGYDFFIDLFSSNRKNWIWQDVFGATAMIISIIAFFIEAELIRRIFK